MIFSGKKGQSGSPVQWIETPLTVGGCNNSAACFDVNKVHGLWETYQQLGRGFRCEDEN